MGIEKSLKILIVEDEKGTAETLSLLLKHKVSAQSEIALDCGAARGKLKETTFDLITLDYQLPDGDGLSLLQEIVAMDDPPPVVMVTGHGDERTAVEAFKHGASGYVVKDGRLSVMLVEEVKAALIKRDLRNAERELYEKNNMLSQVFESVAEGIVIGDPNGVIEFINSASAALFGYESPDEMIGLKLSDFYGDSAERDKLLKILLEEGSVSNYTVQFKRKDGSTFPNKINAALYKDEDGNILHTLAYGSLQQHREEYERVSRLSEEKYREMFENMSSGSGILKTIDNGETFVFVDFNKAAERIENFNRADLIGKTVPEIFPGIEEYGLYNTIKQVWKTGVPEIFPLRLYSDERISGWRSGHVFRLPDGEVVVVYDDSTKQMEDALELEKSNELLSHIYELAPEGIVVTNNEQVIEYANPRTLELFKTTSPGDVIGSHVHDWLTDPRDMEAITDILIREGIIRNYKLKLKCADGSAFWGSIGIILLKDKQGNLYRSAGFVADITEQKRVEEELRRVNQELEAYAHTVSHNLKGPLATIGIAVELLRSEVGNNAGGDAAEILNNIENNSRQGQRQIKDLLDLAKSGQRPADVEDLDVRSVVDEILREVSTMPDAGGVDLSVDDDLGRIKADRAQISQIFSNLITNAYKHNDSSEPHVKISYLGEGKDGSNRYVIHDNGSELPPEEFDKIFIPFYAGKGSGETGLGLSIAKKIARIYGGDILVYNDNGVSFEVSLMDFNENTY